MSIPRGSIWEAMQADALEVIPEGISTDLSRSMDFYKWREQGGYFVTGITKKEFYISCSDRQFGEVLAKEVCTLMDQAFEHRVLLDNAFSQNKIPSNSWLFVTTYYWCVYLCLAWLRLTGKIVTYLPKDEIKRLNSLYGEQTKAPSNGTFVMLAEETNASRRNLKLRRLNTNNFHDGLWQTFASDIKLRLEIAKNDIATLETRLFSAMYLDDFKDGYSWPSKLRNIVNYRVGFGYGAVEGRQFPNILTSGADISNRGTKELIQDAENIATSISIIGVKSSPDQYGKYLLLFGSLLTRALEDQCQAVWNKRTLNHAKWQCKRKTYLRGLGLTKLEIWPNQVAARQ